MIIRCPFEEDKEHDFVQIILEDGRMIEIDDDNITTYPNENNRVPLSKMTTKTLFDV